MPLIPDALARLLTRPVPDTKASRTGPLIAFQTLGGPVWSPRDYAAFAREGFMQNAVVYRCVRMICEAAASIPVCLYEAGQEVETHPFLALLRNPSPHQTGADFLESFLGYLLVSGNAYAEAVAINGELRELYALRPDRMTIIPGEQGWPEGYTYTAAGGSVTFTDDVLPGIRPVLHMRLFHPLDDHYGMSPIEAASVAIDIHNQASRWNKALLDNAARPSGALVYAAREGRLSPEQFERLKAELQDGFQGAKNAGRPLLLEGGLDWKPLSLSPKDMDFIEAKHGAAREIALALGVPPMLLGIPGDNTFSNYQEAQRTFWRNTVVPLVTRALDALSGWLGDAYGGGLTLKPDLDCIEALSPEREALWARLDAATFLTPNEKRAAAGYGPLPGTIGDALKFNPGQPRVPAGSAAGGQWLSPDGTPVEPAQARGPRAVRGPFSVGGRVYRTTQETAAELKAAAQRANQALEAVRQQDPEWRPTPNMYDPASAEGALAAYRADAQEAEARLQVLTRGNVPLGFNSAAEVSDYARIARNGFRAAGYDDAQSYIRGSAVTGNSYRDGSPFDGRPGDPSDYDLAVVSPSLMQRARDLGIPLRGGETRTDVLTPAQMNQLGINDMTESLRSFSQRRTSWVIFKDKKSLSDRGPNLPLY